MPNPPSFSKRVSEPPPLAKRVTIKPSEIKRTLTRKSTIKRAPSVKDHLSKIEEEKSIKRVTLQSNTKDKGIDSLSVSTENERDDLTYGTNGGNLLSDSTSE